VDPDDPDLDRLDRALGALRHDRFGFSRAPGRDLLLRGLVPAPPSSRAYRVLRFVDDQPAGTVTVGQVAEVLLCDMARASRVVHRMVDDGLLTVRVADDDGSQRQVELADAGRRVVAAAAERRRRHLRAATAGWPAEDVRTLIRLVDRLTRTPGTG
jgi:DNA-binding MarR family transcriptional regulator